MIMPTVMKFGGTSVADAQAFENVAAIVRSRIQSVPVVVVSAMSGVTDALLASTNTARLGRPDEANVNLAEIFRRHKDASKELLSNGAAERYSSLVDDARQNITDLLKRLAV